ncbi:hypothetical protein C0995_014089 [Termitomyces sp. Mi166|nr:hypothetical protein C0995_014089 [Termitomyces sp. Mi166\
MNNIQELALQPREKDEHFRILVIGRANAGKTTLLKRVCNTDEDPCIYDKENKLRGIHDINRPFAFRSNPQFIFHDSPGFETGDESQLKKVQNFIKERAKVTDVQEQLHAIWFCFTPNKTRFLLELEEKFFNEDSWSNVPVIAIFTKFDDFIAQVFDPNLDYETNRKNAQTKLEELQVPLFKYKYPPRAGVCLEDMHTDKGNHQQQVKLLMKKTAESLDDLALKRLVLRQPLSMVGVTTLWNVTYIFAESKYSQKELVQDTVLWFRHAYSVIE